MGDRLNQAVDPAALVERVFRAEAGRAHATLVRALGDLGAAEDAVQDAFVDALRIWPERGVPHNPGAWITTTARRRAVDRIRRETRRDEKEQAATRNDGGPDGIGAGGDGADVIADDQLRLIFTCCHPALSPQSQVALTLRLVCGLRTPELARAFLVPEVTIAQRLVRAKAKVRTAGIPVRMPPAHLLPERLPYVLACVYLVFNEGYAASGGQLIRADLCDEAIRLGRLLVELMPDEPEARGLLALMLLQDSRRATRVSATGDLVPLEEQDRRGWNSERIAQGIAEVERAARTGRPGPYQLQAAIAAVHAESRSWEATDWPQLLALYDELYRRSPTPVVALNRAIALSFAATPDAALEAVDTLADDERLARGHQLPAVRADLLRRLGRAAEAAVAYRSAIERAPTKEERRFLTRRLAAVEPQNGRGGGASGGGAI